MSSNGLPGCRRVSSRECHLLTIIEAGKDKNTKDVETETKIIIGENKRLKL